MLTQLEKEYIIVYRRYEHAYYKGRQRMIDQLEGCMMGLEKANELLTGHGFEYLFEEGGPLHERNY